MEVSEQIIFMIDQHKTVDVAISAHQIIMVNIEGIYNGIVDCRKRSMSYTHLEHVMEGLVLKRIFEINLITCMHELRCVMEDYSDKEIAYMGVVLSKKTFTDQMKLSDSIRFSQILQVRMRIHIPTFDISSQNFSADFADHIVESQEYIQKQVTEFVNKTLV